MRRLWYKNAVIYSLDVRLFQDSDGDGIGDFDGLTSRLDYLSSLGVTALWLQPFHPTPYRDGGYDVTDHFAVDEAVGGMAAFTRFAGEADRMGLRFIVDLPLNHTSIDHPWFQAARRDRSSPYRDYYVWVDEPPADSPERIVFRDGDGPSPWTFDKEADQYYLHRFYEDEPDLDHANPRVRDEVVRIVEFWLQLGASGIRVDAAPYIAEKSAADPHQPDRHAILRQLHDCAVAEKPDALLMAEVDVRPDEIHTYFGEGDEMQMLFNFLMNNYTFLALAREEAEPLEKVLGLLPDRPMGGQWANWIRNHDELDLERLTRRERDDVMQAFAPDEGMRVYGRGIRRRFAPMVGGDRRRLELAYSLLFALPGAPVIRYGEEIGMGDDLARPERDAVRTPMQWAPVDNGGFSRGAGDLFAPLVTDEGFDTSAVNVADQQCDRDSLLARMHTFVAVRRQHPEIGNVEPEVVTTGDPAVFALSYRTETGSTVVLHNLGPDGRAVELRRLAGRSYRFDALADRAYDAVDGATWKVPLAGYGYRWISAGPAPTAGDARRTRRHHRWRARDRARSWVATGGSRA